MRSQGHHSEFKSIHRSLGTAACLTSWPVLEKKKPTSLGKFSHARAKEGLLSCAIIGCVAFYNQQWAALNRLMKAKAAFRCCSTNSVFNRSKWQKKRLHLHVSHCKFPQMLCHYVVAPGKEKKAELVRSIASCGTDRGKVFPVIRKSRKFFSYCGSSTDSFSHHTVSSVVQLWTDKNKEGRRKMKMFLLSLKAHTHRSVTKMIYCSLSAPLHSSKIPQSTTALSVLSRFKHQSEKHSLHTNPPCVTGKWVYVSLPGWD